MHEVTGEEGDHDNGPQGEHAVKQRAVVSRRPRGHVNQNDSQTVERVEHDGGNENRFAETHDWSFVGRHHDVVQNWIEANGRGVEHVDQQEKVNRDSGDAVQDP